MSTSLHIQAEEALRVFVDGFGPWLSTRVAAWPPDERGAPRPHDPSYLVDVALRAASHVSELRDVSIRAALRRLRETRNRWARFNELTDAAVAQLATDVASCLRVTGDAFTLASIVHDLPLPHNGHRRSRSAAFRAEQWSRRFDAHCLVVNELVDELIAEKEGHWMPFVAPYHGGVGTEVVVLFQDPGKMTNPTKGGSGFIGCENDDPSAETFALCLDRAEITQGRVSPWNAYPWYLEDQGAVTASRLIEGLDALRRFLDVLGQCHTIVTGGQLAHRSWRRFTDRHPSIAGRYRHLETFHTSGQGIVNGGRQTKAAGMSHMVATMRRAIAIS